MKGCVVVKESKSDGSMADLFDGPPKKKYLRGIPINDAVKKAEHCHQTDGGERLSLKDRKSQNHSRFYDLKNIYRGIILPESQR